MLIALLVLLLPLQGALASTRAVAMLSKGGAGSLLSVSAKATTAPVVQPEIALAHAGHFPAAHHPTGAADHAGALPATTDVSHAAHAADSGQGDTPQRSGKGCDSVAKCCLAGAAAPPMRLPLTASVMATRVAFAAASDTLSCFVPDAPDRPPRPRLL